MYLRILLFTILLSASANTFSAALSADSTQIELYDSSPNQSPINNASNGDTAQQTKLEDFFTKEDTYPIEHERTMHHLSELQKKREKPQPITFTGRAFTPVAKMPKSILKKTNTRMDQQADAAPQPMQPPQQGQYHWGAQKSCWEPRNIVPQETMPANGMAPAPIKNNGDNPPARYLKPHKESAANGQKQMEDDEQPGLVQASDNKPSQRSKQVDTPRSSKDELSLTAGQSLAINKTQVSANWYDSFFVQPQQHSHQARQQAKLLKLHKNNGLNDQELLLYTNPSAYYSNKRKEREETLKQLEQRRNELTAKLGAEKASQFFKRFKQLVYDRAARGETKDIKEQLNQLHEESDCFTVVLELIAIAYHQLQYEKLQCDKPKCGFCGSLLDLREHDGRDTDPDVSDETMQAVQIINAIENPEYRFAFLLQLRIPRDQRCAPFNAFMDNKIPTILDVDGLKTREIVTRDQLDPELFTELAESIKKDSERFYTKLPTLNAGNGVTNTVQFLL